jgi:hypothetical protein
MDNKTHSVWLRFGPVPPMGGFTLCGVYRTWLDHNGRVFNVPEATALLEAFNSQITRAAERHARVVVHGDLNLDLDRSGDPATEVANSATEVTNGTKEVTNSASVPTNLAMVPSKPMHAMPTRHAWTTCTRVASRTRP